MIVYAVVGENRGVNNVSARAVYSRREDADAHLADDARMWFDDRAVVIELEVDKERPSHRPLGMPSA